MIERRTFIKGLLAAVTSTEAIVKLATPAEASALVRNAPVALQQIGALTTPSQNLFDSMVYVKQGDVFQPFGYIQEVNFYRDVVETGSEYDGYVRYTPGLLRDDLRFEGRQG